MHRIVRSPLAEEDLIDIWQYSYNKWGMDKAVEYLLQLDAGIQALANNPKMGKSRENTRRGYRSIQINRHVIYYRIDAEIVDIIRVLHERMIPNRHLWLSTIKWTLCRKVFNKPKTFGPVIVLGL